MTHVELAVLRELKKDLPYFDKLVSAATLGRSVRQ